MVNIEIWVSATCHACPAISITFKDFTVSKSLAKSICEVSDTVCLHPLTNEMHLWYWLPLKHITCDNILKFVTDVVQRMEVFGKLIQNAIHILSSIPSPCITPSMCLSLLLFRVYVLKFSRIIVMRSKLTHIFSKNLNPYLPVHIVSKFSDKMSFRQQLDACRQKHVWEAGILFWGEHFEFLGHTT